MKFNYSALLLLAVSVWAMGATAATVESGSVTTFQSGSTLSSSAMNTTISALVTAINDNAARIAALEEVQPTQLDIAGRAYCVASTEGGFWIDNQAGTEGVATQVGVTSGMFRAGLIFNTGGTVTLNAYEDFYKEGFPSFAVIDGSEPLGQEQGTWTLTGNILEVVFGDERQKFVVSSTGEAIIGGFSYQDVDSQGSGRWYTSSLAILVEVKDSSTCNF